MKWAGLLQSSTILFAARGLRTRKGQTSQRPSVDLKPGSHQPAALQLSFPAALSGAAPVLLERQDGRVFKNLETGFTPSSVTYYQASYLTCFLISTEVTIIIIEPYR